MVTLFFLWETRTKVVTIEERYHHRIRCTNILLKKTRNNREKYTNSIIKCNASKCSRHTTAFKGEYPHEMWHFCYVCPLRATTEIINQNHGLCALIDFNDVCWSYKFVWRGNNVLCVWLGGGGGWVKLVNNLTLRHY